MAMTFKTNLKPDDNLTRELGASDARWKLHGKIQPIVSKTYASTSQYATAANADKANFYFMSVKPDTFIKPWTIWFKVHTFCPSYANGDAITYCKLSGRNNSMIYQNWNERYEAAHYYICSLILTQAGFDAGLGHAIGISMLYGWNYTNSAYYRTFEVEFYESENCTVTLLDSPVLKENWTNYNTTNYTGPNHYNAVDRGLMESGDNDTTGRDYLHSAYLKNGTNLRCGPYTIFGLNRNSEVQGISLYQSNYTSSTTSINTARVYNTAGFDWSRGLYYTNVSTNYATGADMNISPAPWFYALDFRYTDNCVANANANTLGLVIRKPVYFRGVIKEDGLFYLAPLSVTYNSTTYKRAWTQDIPTAVETDGTYQYVYWLVGYPYYSSSYAGALYQLDLISNNTLYWYHNGRFEEYGAVNISEDTISGWGFTKTTGTVTSVATGTGLSGGTITSTGTISLSTATTAVIGGVILSNSAGSDITTGTAATGNSTAVARANHTHKVATATTAAYGVVQLSSATNSTSNTLAATPAAVKAAYDLANGKTANTGTVTSVATGTGLSGGPITSTGTITLAAATTSTIGGVVLSNVTGSAIGTAATGTSTAVARADHTHALSTSYATAGHTHSYKPTQTAVSSATTASTTAATTFVSEISQNTNGVISYTTKPIATATTSTAGIVQLSSATNSTSNTLAATPAAVKAAYDLANGKTANTGTVTSVATGTGLSGGPITATGTISLATATTSTIGGVILSNSAGSNVTTGTAATGTSTAVARADHTHKVATATTAAYGVVQLSSATNSTSNTLAATPAAVKAAYDLANGKTANTGTVTSVATGTGLTGGPITTTGTISLATGVISTTGNYGPTANASPNYSSGFTVPQITVDTYGRVTSAVNRTITLPAGASYSAATSAADGLMTSAMVATLEALDSDHIQIEWGTTDPTSDPTVVPEGGIYLLYA